MKTFRAVVQSVLVFAGIGMFLGASVGRVKHAFAGAVIGAVAGLFCYRIFV